MALTSELRKAIKAALKAGDELGYGRNYSRGLVKFGREGMTKEARMARAREMGFDTPAYHVTGEDFTAFDPSKGGRDASFFGLRPELARRASQNQNSNRTIPAVLPSSEIDGLALSPAERAAIDALPERIDGVAAAEAIDPPNGVPWSLVYDETRGPSGDVVFTKRNVPDLAPQDALASGRDVYGQQLGGWGSREGDRWAAARALSRGQSGFAQSDEAGVSLAMADPSRIRSPFATFDPARKHRRDLMAALALALGGGAGAEAARRGLDEA